VDPRPGPYAVTRTKYSLHCPCRESNISRPAGVPLVSLWSEPESITCAEINKERGGGGAMI
jgi:hypothetical protein